MSRLIFNLCIFVICVTKFGEGLWFYGGCDFNVVIPAARMIRENGAMYVSWMGLGFHIFVLLCNPASCILHWYTLPDKSISSVALRSETAINATACQSVCAAAADSVGCRSVNFYYYDELCELFSISAVETVLRDETGTNIYESCSMITPMGGWTVVCIDS